LASASGAYAVADAVRAGRRDGHDPAARGHVARGGDGAEHERARVEAHRRVEVRRVHLHDPPAERADGAAHEGIQPAEPCGGLVDERGRIVADVAAHQARPGDVRAAPAADRHLVAPGEQRLGHGAADAARAAGHEHLHPWSLS
jgi:hypothetical protein